MKCPECGATLKKISRKCTECGALLKKNSGSPVSDKPRKVESTPTPIVKHPEPQPPIPSLIEFPGINRNALPEWRKELNERVREKQERRAREAMLEASDPATVAADTSNTSAPTLELLPQSELPPLNPIVEAALKRIERAHLESSSFSRGNSSLATAVAYDEPQAFAPANEGSAREYSSGDVDSEPSVEARPFEKTHNLAVVRNPVATLEETSAATKKPKRLIGETNDPALNYLDKVPTALLVERREYVAASPAYRLLAAIVDLAILFALTSPLFALNGLTRLDWQDWRVIAFSAGSFMLVGFFYLTIVTAFTGRTLGMRLCRLRIVDARNGLIPTGSQAAGRAFIYLLSVASAGILSLYVFIDSEKNTLQDRFTRTAVIRT